MPHEDETHEKSHHHKEEVAKVRAAPTNGIKEDAKWREDGVENSKWANEHEANGKRAYIVVDIDGVGVGLPLIEICFISKGDVLRRGGVDKEEVNDRSGNQTDNDDVDVVVPLKSTALDL